jgi:serine/threonine protein kinase
MAATKNNPTSKFIKIQYQPNDIVLNKYQIISRLGTGGMSSIVYKALDTTIKNPDTFIGDDKYVAIKIVNRDET